MYTAASCSHHHLFLFVLGRSLTYQCFTQLDWSRRHSTTTTLLLLQSLLYWQTERNSSSIGATWMN